MSLKWNVYEVFIASPMDVSRLRNEVEEAINATTASLHKHHTILVPRRWEDAVPQLHVSPQVHIDWKMVDPADILIAFFGRTIGAGGTIHEIRRFITNGKAASAMLYFPIQLDEEAKELKDIRSEFEERGLVLRYRDDAHLLEQITSHLAAKVTELNASQDSWPRLKSAAAEIHRFAPHALARFLIGEMLRAPSREVATVELEASQFDTRGLGNYRSHVHELLETEGVGTKILAVCGEKGLSDYDDHRMYFEPFYEFAKSGEHEVYRAFVERATAEPHSEAIQRTIADHNAADGVFALEVPTSRRAELALGCPGICDDLDHGFGLVGFARPTGEHSVVVHCGRERDLTSAEFTEPAAVRPLIKLIFELYKASNAYRLETEQLDRGQINELAEWVDRTMMRP